MRTLEDDPPFNAGFSSVVNSKGVIELDALITDGSDLNLGAVTGVGRLPTPVSLGQLVLAVCHHSILASQGEEAGPSRWAKEAMSPLRTALHVWPAQPLGEAGSPAASRSESSPRAPISGSVRTQMVMLDDDFPGHVVRAGLGAFIGQGDCDARISEPLSRYATRHLEV